MWQNEVPSDNDTITEFKAAAHLEETSIKLEHFDIN